jgi:uncharacterized secreted protein with C-terminal beta-propeller domain
MATLAAPVQKTTDSSEALPTAAPAPAASGTGAASPEFSTTNVQEAGIDEPDVVKSDGRYVYVVANRTLRVIDVTGDAPRLVGTLTLDGGYAHQLLLRGKRRSRSTSHRRRGRPPRRPSPRSPAARPPCSPRST